MAVDITVTEGNGAWAGSSANIEQYSSIEEATPLYPHDSAGSVGSLSFSVREAADSRYLIRSKIRLSDMSNGTTEARVVGLNASEQVLSVEAQTSLQHLVGWVEPGPYTGTLGGYITDLIQDTGIVPNIELSISAVPLDIQAWQGDRWEFLKQLGAVYQFDISWVSNEMVVRTKRSRTATETNLAASSWSVASNQQARSVTVTYSNDVYYAETLVWPYGGWTMETEVHQVDVGEVKEYVLETPVSLMSIKQPTCVLFVDAEYSGPNSVYAVAGNDGLPIPPALWNNTGGKVTLKLDPEDPRSIIMTIKGPELTHLAPFSLSVNSGGSEAYSALRIVGEGVASEPLSIEVFTGAVEGELNSAEGQSFESPAVRTYEQALQAGLGLAAASVGNVVTISGETRAINRPNDKGIFASEQFSFYNTYIGETTTYASFNAAEGTTTFDQLYDKVMLASSAAADDGSFQNQAFGNSAGARVLRPEANYRIVSATITQNGVQYTAVEDTLVSDFNERYDSMTFADFNAAAAGLTFNDYNLTPLLG